MSYEGSTFIGKLEELSLSGLPLELELEVAAAAVVVVGGLYSGGSSVDGDSILIAQQPMAVQGVERNAWETEGRRRCIRSIICNISRRSLVHE